MRAVASPLPHRLIFPLTVYSAELARGVGGAEITMTTVLVKAVL